MNRRAFTLLEVLLALGLLVVLGVATVSFIFRLLDRREMIATASASMVGADVLFEELESRLVGTFVVDGAGAPGLVGRAAEITLHSRVSRDPREGAGDSGKVHFWFDAQTGALMGEEGDGAAEPLVQGVAAVSFRYYDGREWFKSFNTVESQRLPAAVEVAIWFGPAPAADSADTIADEADFPSRDPDRLRIIVVPDGPVSDLKPRS